MRLSISKWNVSQPCASPEEEEVGVVLHHSVGLTGQIPQPGQVESWSRGHLQHAAPGLVAQQLDLRRVQQPFLRALVPIPEHEGQRVIEAPGPAAQGLSVERQDPGVHDYLRQLRSAALAQGSPLRRQLTAARKSVQVRQEAERCEEENRGKHSESAPLWYFTEENPFFSLVSAEGPFKRANG